MEKRDYGKQGSSFQLPECEAGAEAAAEWLVARKGLSEGLVDRMLREGRIAQTTGRECLFVGDEMAELWDLGKNEKRKSLGRFRQNAWSTEEFRDSGGKILYAESALEALSLKEMFPSAVCASVGDAPTDALARGVGMNFGREQVLCLGAGTASNERCAAVWGGLLLFEALGPTFKWISLSARLGDIVADLAGVVDKAAAASGRPLRRGAGVEFPPLEIVPGGSERWAIPIKEHNRPLFGSAADADGLVVVDSEQVRRAGAKWKLSRMRPPYGRDWNESWQIVREAQGIEEAMADARAEPGGRSLKKAL